SEDELAHHPALQHVRRRLLETALDYYQDFLAQHDDEPSVHAALASSRARVSQILTELSTLQGPTLLTILQDPNVQADLGLGADQKKQLAQLAPKGFESLAREFWESFTLDPKERRAKALEVARAAERALADILSQDQKRRFQQIALQVQQQGRHGFSDPKVVEALKLTRPQREQIRKIQNEAYGAWRDYLVKSRKVKAADFWGEVQDKILNVLRPEQ